MPREIQHPSNKPLPLYVHQMNGYGAACIDILVSKDSRCVLTDLELVIHAGTIWKLTIQAERRIVDTSCPLRGEEDGMTDLVRLYLCEMRSKPGEAVVGARAVSLQRFSLGVFEFIADHSFAFVHCQVVLGKKRNVHQATEENVQLLMTSNCSHSANKTKSATALILLYILALVCYAREEVIDPIASFSGSFFFFSRERKRGWERGCRLDS